MKAEWAVWRGAFSPDECESILRRGVNLPVMQANQGLNGENPDLSYRRSKVKWMHEDIYRDVFERMLGKLGDILSRHMELYSKYEEQ